MTNDNRSTRLFVGGLAYKARKKDVVEFFEQFGDIADVYIPFNHEQPGMNKGFCFVEFIRAEDAAKALALDGKAGPGDRIIFVKYALKRTNKRNEERDEQQKNHH